MGRSGSFYLPVEMSSIDNDPNSSFRKQADARYTRQGTRYHFDRLRQGPVSTDFTAITPNAAADPSYNRGWLVQNSALPADWPFEIGRAVGYFAAPTSWGAKQPRSIAGSPLQQDRTLRVMHDGTKFALQTVGAPEQAIIHIDGRPASLTPYVLPAGYLTITFPTAKPRLIEIRTRALVTAAYCATPYRLWEPPPTINPSVVVMGDSYVRPVVLASTATPTVYTQMGIYQAMPDLLNVTDMWAEGVGSTGYLAESAAGAGDAYGSRLAAITAQNPDVLVVHGGGANDIFQGKTVADTITAAVALFTSARAALPRAKLVFVEGIRPSGWPIGYLTSYLQIRQGVQAALTGTGVYYLDLTTNSPIIGTGNVGTPSGAGNGDLYIGADGTHPTPEGAAYLRHIIASKLRRVLADDGSLINTAIT